jgi:CBS domain-containing protein
MNILFFLTPKAACSCLTDDDTIRQAMERMEHNSYTSLPILSRAGEYRGTLTEGDLLWALKNLCKGDMKRAEQICIMDIDHRCDNQPVSVSTDIEDLFAKATDQNFVPVIDDKDTFIGLITRKAIVQYCLDHYIHKSEPVAV